MATSKKPKSKQAAAKKSGNTGKKSAAATPTKKKAGASGSKTRSKPKPAPKPTGSAKSKPSPRSKPAAKGKPVAKAKPAPKKPGGARSDSRGTRQKPAPKAAASAVKSRSKRAPASAEVKRDAVLTAMAAAAAPEGQPETGPAPDIARTSPSPGTAGRISSRELAIELARLADDDKCSDIVVLDVRKMSPISDFVVVVSGTSDRQMRAVADHAEDLGAELGHQAFRSSKDPRALWLLIDFSDVVIHIFEPNTRAHYDIEMMWGDAKRIPWERESSPKTKPVSRSRKALSPS